MELIKVSEKITQKIDLLEKGRHQLQVRAEAKALSTATYDRELAKSILMLKNNEEEIIWQGEKIKNIPVTILEKVAKGLCWKAKLEAEKNDLMYRNACIGMVALEQEISALQSIYRFQSEM